MPSGPKKRRAAQNKNNASTNYTGEICGAGVELISELEIVEMVENLALEKESVGNKVRESEYESFQDFLKEKPESPFQLELISTVEVDVKLNGYREELAGLLKTLLEQTGRLKTTYEEAMSHITEISLQAYQLLEKIDSGNC